MESLKFESSLVGLVLSKQKYCTWRLWNEKALELGQIIELVKRPQMEVFATAIITSLVVKTMGEIASEDRKGHEQFESDEEMYETYSRYYNRSVDQNSPVTIAHFELTKN